MTIRFLRQWNGYDSQDVVTLSASEESRLIAAGLATASLPDGYQSATIVNLESDGDPTETTRRIQAVLDRCKNVVLNGSCTINGTLKIGDNTSLTITPGSLITRANSTNLPMIKAKCLYDTPVSVTMAWSAKDEATVTWTAHGRAVGDYVWLQGADQTEFRGVFRVKSVTDANTFLVMLFRLPTTSPTGTITAIIPNKGITLDCQGVLDGNQTNQSINTATDRHLVILCGTNLNIRNYNFRNSVKFGLCVAAVNQFKIKNVWTDGTNSDVVKIYGPAINGIIDGIHVQGSAGDDILSLQPKEPAAYAAYDFSNGDVLNIAVSNIFADKTSTSSLVTYATVDELIDNISFDNIQLQLGCRVDSGSGLVGTQTGSLFFKNVKLVDRVLPSYGVSVNANGTIKQLVFDKFNNIDTDATTYAFKVQANATVQNLIVTESSHYCSGTSQYFCVNDGVIKRLMFDRCNFIGSTNPKGRGVNNTLTIEHCVFRNCYVKQVEHLYNNSAGSTSGKTVHVDSCHFDTGYGCLNLAQNTKVILTNNTGSLGAYGYVRINGSGKQADISSSGNQVTGSTLFVKVGGSELLTMYGIDIPIDLATLSRAGVGQMAKVKTNVGTILANNIAVNDETNTTNSWKQLSDTSKVY